MTQHTTECLELRAKILKEQQEYDVKYPNYCRECNGIGGFHETYDPSPSGVSLSSGTLTDFVPCENEAYELKCHRCGADLAEEHIAEGKPCPNCEGVPGAMRERPYTDICICPEDELPEDFIPDRQICWFGPERLYDEL